MGAKSILLLGLIISALFIYLCIDSKKDALYTELVEKKEAVVVKPPKEIKEKILEPIIIKKPKKEPSFAYVSGKKAKIAAIFSKEDNASQIVMDIDKLCANDNCIKDVQFTTNVAPYHFSKDTLGLIKTAKQENIKDFALYIDKKSLTIEGTLVDKSQEKLLEPYLKSFLDANYTIENTTNIETFTPAIEEKIDITTAPIKEKKKTKIIKKEIIVEAPRDIFVTPQHLTTKEAASQIDNILSSNVIRFDYRSSDISKSSKKTLDDVTDILLGLDNIMIEVAGYTDSKGDAIYNKVLSQKRADTVRAYLVESGLRGKLIKSKGYGEKNPIASPQDIINRRVEIHIIEGK